MMSKQNLIGFEFSLMLRHLFVILIVFYFFRWGGAPNGKNEENPSVGGSSQLPKILKLFSHFPPSAHFASLPSLSS